MAKEKQQELNEFSLDDLRNNFETEDKERREELGLKDLIVMNRVTDVEIMSDKIKKVDSSFGDRFVFDCGEKNLMASKYLAQQILKLVKTVPQWIRIYKSGEKKETRYEVVLLDKNGNEVEELKNE